MKIIWRDDVRLARVTDYDGIRYEIPYVTDGLALLRVGLADRQRERKLARAAARKQALEGRPKHSPLNRKPINWGQQ